VRPVRIAVTGALEGRTCIVILVQINQQIAVGEPSALVMRLRVEYLPHAGARVLQSASGTVGAG